MKNRNLDHKDHWITPIDFYTKLYNIYNFTFDPCPYRHDISLWDGLKIEWGDRNFVNPPYSLKLKNAFVKKGIEEYNKGKLCVFLLPVSTSTKLFHDIIFPNASEIIFVRGRLCFTGINTKGEWVDKNPGMHDSMVVVFNPDQKNIVIKTMDK